MRNLENLTISVSTLTEKIYAGFVNKSKTKWVDKKDVTNEFLQTVIQRFGGFIEEITNGEDTWEITVKKINPVPNTENINNNEIDINKTLGRI